MAYFRRAAADNVVHAEIFFDPQTHTARGVAMGAVIGGLAARPRARAARARPVERADPVLPAPSERRRGDRHARARRCRTARTSSASASTAASAATRRRSSRACSRAPASSACTGSPTPARKGRRPTSRARSTCCTSSASTTACAASKTRRWCERLAREGVALTVCPLSNLKLRVFDTLADHNLGALLAAGIKATVNSDDPAYFGGYINANFVATFEALPQLGAADAYALARNSFDASFCDAAAKRSWHGRLDAVFAAA